MIRTLLRFTMIAALAAAVYAAPARAADISGAGATFPYPVYAKWAEEYKKETGIGLNYQPIGSGGGIKQIMARTVTFGASDMPLKPEELEKEGLMQWPMVIGGVVPVVNLADIKPGEMVLNGAVLAAIYMGKINFWDAPEIKALNPSLSLPHKLIATIHRADASGTTFLFTHYLGEVDKTFAEKIGSATAVEWPTGFGGKGNEGVSNMVRQTEGAIGYVEFAYAMQNKLSFAHMQNREGKVVEPSITSFQAAASHADWAAAPDYFLILDNQPGGDTWPITGASFIIMAKEPIEPKVSEEALRFFAWAYDKGDSMAAELMYVPMPDNVVGMIKNSWKKISTAGRQK